MTGKRASDWIRENATAEYDRWRASGCEGTWPDWLASRFDERGPPGQVADEEAERHAPHAEETSPACERALGCRTMTPTHGYAEGYRCGWLDGGANERAESARLRRELGQANEAILQLEADLREATGAELASSAAPP